MTQLGLMGMQGYLALIGLFGSGENTSMMLMYMLFILASAYSFFSPVRLAGVDAAQSNDILLQYPLVFNHLI